MATIAGTPAAGSRGLRRHVTAGFVMLLVLGSTMAAVAGQRDGAPSGPMVAVTAANGYTAPEINLFNYLRGLDGKLVETVPMATLYSVGEQTCADFSRGDTQDQVSRLDDATVQRKAMRMSAVQVGELVPAAVLELCPAYLPTITVSVA